MYCTKVHVQQDYCILVVGKSRRRWNQNFLFLLLFYDYFIGAWRQRKFWIKLCCRFEYWIPLPYLGLFVPCQFSSSIPFLSASLCQSFKPQYWSTYKSPDWLPHISLKNKLREFDKRSEQDPLFHLPYTIVQIFRYRLWQKAWKAWREYISSCRAKKARHEIAHHQGKMKNYCVSYKIFLIYTYEHNKQAILIYTFTVNCSKVFWEICSVCFESLW